MGLAASLFYSADAGNETLLKRITPNSQQLEYAQESWHMLRDYLTEQMSMSGNTTKTWLQGSYKFGTQVRPASKNDEYDVDMGIYFIWSGEDGPDEDAVAFKCNIQDACLNYDAENVSHVLDPPKDKCTRVHYYADFHIDVPCYHLDEDQDRRVLATEAGWVESDPKRLLVWFWDSFSQGPERDLARRGIRYFKMWDRLTFDSAMKSLTPTLITVLVSEYLLDEKPFGWNGDDEMFTSVLEGVLARLTGDPVVLNPSDTSENLAAYLSDGELSNVLNRLREAIRSANDALDTPNVLLSALAWSNVFGHFFPLPEVDPSLAEISESMLPVLSIVPEVSINITSRTNASFSKSEMNTCSAPKACDLTFSIVNRNAIPNDATISWIVRNEGEEAELENDLGHSRGNGLTAVESTAYNGTHYMDCFIRRSGQLLGWRRIPVRVSGPAIAPRIGPRRKKPNFRR